MQHIIVHLIGGALLVYIGWKIAGLLRNRRKSDPCAGCAGCDQREDFRKKQSECDKKTSPSQNNQSN